MNWVAGPIRQLTNDAGVAYDANPVWSPSGRYIYFNAEIDGDPAILYVATEADWYGYYDIYQVAKHNANLAWSPNGRYVAFDSERDGNRDIYVFDRETETEHRLTNNGAYDGEPAWSPDGTQIAFVSYRNGNWDIYVMDAGGEDEYLRRLTNKPAWESGARAPAWSPDGTQIVYEDGNGISLYVMDADGSNVRDLPYVEQIPLGRLTENTSPLRIRLFASAPPAVLLMFT